MKLEEKQITPVNQSEHQGSMSDKTVAVLSILTDMTVEHKKLYLDWALLNQRYAQLSIQLKKTKMELVKITSKYSKLKNKKNRK